jgi:hypothetical protein
VRRAIWNLLGIVLLIVFLVPVVQAEEATQNIQNPMGWMNQLEEMTLGTVQPGSLLERLDQFEMLVTGKRRDASLVERLTRLDTVILTNQPQDISLLYKTQALEWALFKEVKSGPLKSRLEQMEQLLFGRIYAGPLTKRLEKLINQIYPGGVVRGRWVSIPEGLLIRVRMLNELNSKQNHSGDSFQYEVAETVMYNQAIVFPKGMRSVGLLREIKRPGNLGRDAVLKVDFQKLRALDGTPVAADYGAKASEMNSSHTRAVGISTAGMMAFGPGGILFGMVIKGKEKVIPEGSEFYIQVAEPARIYTLIDDRR